MEVHRSARKHGISDEAIHHAVSHSLAEYDISDDEGPRRVLVIGPDTAANLFEVVVIERDDGSRIAIHAMPLRPRYLGLLP